MTEDERKQAIKAVLPDNVDGETRPTDSVPTDFPLSTDFPQLIGNDPVSADVFNLVNRQMLSNDKALQELISTSSGGGIKSVERENDTLKFTNSDSTTLSVSINDISHATNADNATKADTATKADSTTKLATARTITLSGKATGSASFDGSANASINVTAVTADSCSGNSATASEVAWTGITGKPSTYTPATHNHDTSYPSTSGSRATGTWGISVTGSAGSVAWDNVTGTSANVTQRKSATAVTSADYPNNQAHVPDMSFMAYWNGAYNSSNSSNLKYCANGTIIGSNTISSQSVKYATSAGTATTATTANAVAWGNVTGKPSTYTPASHTHAYLPLTGGTTTGKVNIQSVTLENMPQIKRTDGANFAGIRCENTNGYLGAIGIRGEKNSAIVRVDTSDTSYPVLDSSNYNNYAPTKTGTGATGTWGISISGNAATATKATTANAVAWDNVTGKPSTYTPASHTHSYLPLSGGTLSDSSNTTINIKCSSSNKNLCISGGNGEDSNASITLYGGDNSTTGATYGGKGGFKLKAVNGSKTHLLIGSNALEWDGHEVEYLKSFSWTPNGYSKMYVGGTREWGSFNLTTSTLTYTVTFPITLTWLFNIQLTTSGVSQKFTITKSSTTGFTITFDSTPASVGVIHWLALGA